MDTPAQHRANQAKFQKKPSEVKKRELRNDARAKMIRKGVAHKHDGMDVDHKHGIGQGNKASNLRVITRHHNRDYKRNSKGKQVSRYGL